MNAIPPDLQAALHHRYELQRVLGRGGMATVYLARDLKHRRQVAVKVLSPDIAANIGAERFVREIDIAAGLTHPHILALYDSGEAAGFLYYVMPYVAGESLRARLIRERIMDVETALVITTQIAEALTYAHREGVIHRDIKPENVLFSEGHAIVADFGIARAISTAGIEQLTRSGFPLGTPGYMSPEQAAGTVDLDERTDVYGLACLFYEMVIGETPGMWPSEEAVRLKSLMDAPPEHRERLNLYPGGLEQVLVRALAPRPELRIATAAEFVRALAASMEGKRKYGESEVRQILERAADMQVAQPTEDGAMSIAGVQRVAAEVGIAPEHVAQAAGAIQTLVTPQTRFFGLATRMEIEQSIDGEVPDEEYDVLLDMMQRTIGHKGRIEPTPGRSLQWSSGIERMPTPETTVHIIPRAGCTKIRITEDHSASMAVGASALVIATIPLIVVLPDLNLSLAAALSIAGAVYGGLAWVGVKLTRSFRNKRADILTGLLDNLSRHVVETAQREDRP